MEQPLVDLSSCVRLQRLRLSTKHLGGLDDWIMPMLRTITNAPEELTLHEAPMSPSYGIEQAGVHQWEEMDACLGELATKAAKQGHRLKFILTTGMFGSSACEPRYRSKLSSFTERGTFTVLPTPIGCSHSRGPF